MTATATKPRTNPKYVKLTTTAPIPDPPEGRYKSVFANSQECAHKWASRSIPSGRSGNTYFDDNVFYSYGRHFPAARWVELKNGRVVVFVTTRTYSSTTSGHMSDVRRSIPRDAIQFQVENVLANTREEHTANLNAIRNKAMGLMGKATRARANKEGYLSQCQSLIAAGNAYAEAVGIRDRIAEPENLEADRLAAEQREKQQRARETAKQKAAYEKAMTEYAEKLAIWHDGGEHPGYPPYGHEKAYLRIKGSVLETSLRVALPLRLALPVLKLVRSGQRWHLNDIGTEDIVLDGYHLRDVDPESRTVTIGCHVIDFDEIERLATKHNL